MIYRFGGKGNDWCFVKTPVQYRKSGKPNPLLICNHGNGWVMDGSEAKANFTSKTQYGIDRQNSGAYLDVTDPLYNNYSNPLIETFLEAGYVVCGAQNYGDLLYGNEECRQACAHFYQHMLEHYHVDSGNVFMLGCSNGFMTTLNTADLLGANVLKGLIGLYPLCNLQHAYEVTHQEGVRQAYNISSDAEWVRASRIYNPCSRRGRKWPPMLLIGSMTDDVLPMQAHMLRLAALVKGEGGTADTILIDQDGIVCGHGHWRHFQAERIAAWCEARRC